MNAVYLIIAGALLGPIEPSEKLGSVDCNHRSVTGSGQVITRPGPERPACEIETTAETCERAMKEIGAVPINRLLSTGEPPPREYRMVPTDRYEFGGKEVLCIPAPSGLRK